MSVASELTALNGYIIGAYDEVGTMGGTVPQNKNMANLSTAIASIPAGGGGGINREANNAGVYGAPTSSFTFSLPSNATDLATYALYYAFYGCFGIAAADMHTLTSISNASAMYWAFYNCGSLTSVDLRSLTTVSGSSAVQSAFQACPRLASADLSSLTTVSGMMGMNAAFSGCSALSSINLASLTTLSGTSCMANAFNSTSIASVNFASLSSITGSQALARAFGRCGNLRSLSFPSLTSNSFGSNTNQFNSMLAYCTNVTVHFPASIQSTIGSWSDVTSGFSGTNTTVLFDL